MKNFKVLWRTANRNPRFDTSTAQPRKRWFARDIRVVAAAVALALVAGSGLALVSVSSAAEAHTPSIKVSCQGVTVTGKSYDAPDGEQNFVTFETGGKKEVIYFGKAITKTFAFADSTKPNSYKATITAYNAKTESQKQQWNGEWDGTSVPCVAQSIIDVTAPRCEVANGSTDITATFKGLVADRAYEVTLAGGAEGTKTETYTSQQTTGSYTWKGTAAGQTYTVTIVDTTNRQLTASKTVSSVPCPELSGIAIVATECTVPGENASIKIDVSDLVVGREYRIDIVNAGENGSADTVVESQTFTADKDSGAYISTTAPSGSYYATIVDMSESNAVPLESRTHTFLPCPQELAPPTITATQCDAVSTSPQGTIAIAVDGLVPGRTYRVAVMDAADTVMHAGNDFVAASSRFEFELTDMAEGTYTAIVTDTALASFTAKTTATLIPCATNDTTIELIAEQCTAPGGASALSATVSDFAIGREYLVTLTQNNIAVGDSQRLDSRSGEAQQLTFESLEAGQTYRVVVTDTQSNPAVTVAADIDLSDCPGNPGVVLSKAECNVLGASIITVSTSELVVGQTYTVSVAKSTGEAIDGVVPVVFAAEEPTRSLDIANVPNGGNYTVSIVNADESLSAQGDITLEVCDLPTFPLPPEGPPTVVPPAVVPAAIDLPTLAYTGSSIIAPILAGLGFLQLGLVLVGLSIARRRLAVRKS